MCYTIWPHHPVACTQHCGDSCVFVCVCVCWRWRAYKNQTIAHVICVCVCVSVLDKCMCMSEWMCKWGYGETDFFFPLTLSHKFICRRCFFFSLIFCARCCRRCRRCCPNALSEQRIYSPTMAGISGWRHKQPLRWRWCRCCRQRSDSQRRIQKSIHTYIIKCDGGGEKKKKVEPMFVCVCAALLVSMSSLIFFTRAEVKFESIINEKC